MGPRDGDARFRQEQHLSSWPLTLESRVDRLLDAREGLHEHVPHLVVRQRGDHPDVGSLEHPGDAGGLLHAQPVRLLVGGDFNCIADAALDQSGGAAAGLGRTAGYAGGLQGVQETWGLRDVYRVLYPTRTDFTHVSCSAGTAARLDRWLTDDDGLSAVEACEVRDGWPGDHRAVALRLAVDSGPLSKGIVNRGKRASKRSPVPSTETS